MDTTTHDEAAYLREVLRKTQARLTDAQQCCGRAEGALSVVEAQLAAERARVVILSTELRVTRGELSDLRDAYDAATAGPDMTTREIYGAGR